MASLTDARCHARKRSCKHGFLCLELFVHCSEIVCQFVGLFIGGTDAFLLSCVHSMREYCDCEKNLNQIFDRCTFSAPLKTKQWFLECHLSVMYICLVSA
jgi:hypothetical protein